ncbi:hypothetical protein [Pararhizobium mangrovi]|uniref:Uncharacterized protein n=1 Tax=Pararhizobium mangrovi TaxID=2590452 RepID=A0A506UGI6_9HYPH|nr:hypothetical protein [Pararhizobium mangrovi]TPW31177.1 hypothetical protein FJU11_02975 [Pararhizobium mangrovi]
MKSISQIFADEPYVVATGGNGAGFENSSTLVFTNTYTFGRQEIGSTNGTLTVDYEQGQQVRAVLTENVSTIALQNMPVFGGRLEMILVQDEVGGRTVSWPAAWVTGGSFAPEVTATPGARDRFVISNDGFDIYLDIAGQDYR